MKIKVKKQNKDGIARFETEGTVREILVNEDILNPKNESIALCFRGKESSGIVEMSPGELESLYAEIKKRIHLIKGFKKLSGGGAIRF